MKKLFLLLSFFLLSRHNKDEHIVLLYLNDAHDISPVKDALGDRGGIARLQTIVRRVKSKNSNVRVIFGGDLAGGTLFGAVFRGFPQVKAFNRIPVDIANFRRRLCLRLESSPRRPYPRRQRCWRRA